MLGLLVTVYFYRDKSGTVPDAILPVLLVLLLVNTVRATFLFHQYQKAEKENQISIPA